MERDRRRTPRYMFFASAELLDEKSSVRVNSRVSELSRNGCYLDMMNPFPVNTMILLKIWKEQGNTIETKARIAYSQPNVGAGVVFVDLDAKYVPLLETWLVQAATG